ncbi:serine acetyltransferase [Kordiimonas sediminis]|uniref:Serine acetyltransferase n=1 Tax=Kordiimonas sediminis TaxID=1735581 RepID=A0A919AM12_9PROT|nr:serine acetyltransferase [Kordiimonas sediminis]GHF12313.1 serine acetyltransferase [Kordiimonas sediminis]
METAHVQDMITEDSFDAETIRQKLQRHYEQYDKPTGLTLESVGHLTERLMGLMFPHLTPENELALSLDERLESIRNEIKRICKRLSGAHCASLDAFLSDLPDIASVSHQDAVAIYEGDPAARSLEEVILCYPGLFAVTAYRIAHDLLKRDIPLLPRMITEFAHQKTGMDIHPGAKIGSPFFVDHATEIVIGETTVIGNNVKLYQGVTLGALRIKPGDKVTKRHPTIEDNVVIYANATILGGETVVGRNSIIGGNVWLTQSVPPHSRVMFKSCETETITKIVK